MAWIIFYTILVIVYGASLGYSFYHPGSLPEIVARLSGGAALLTGFANALQKTSLRVYFFSRR